MDAPCSPQQKNPAEDTVKRLYLNSKVAPLVRNLPTETVLFFFCDGLHSLNVPLL